MTGIIQNFFEETGWSIWRELCVFFCSMVPVIELRGAIPLGAGLGLEWWQCYLLSVVGNFVPVPFILLFINAILRWMSNSKVKFFNKVANWLLKKAEKNRKKVERFAFFGVALFVAIPLPATGAWTGSLVAAVFNMNFLKSMISALIGILIAGAIMTLISYGFVAIVF